MYYKMRTEIWTEYICTDPNHGLTISENTDGQIRVMNKTMYTQDDIKNSPSFFTKITQQEFYREFGLTLGRLHELHKTYKPEVETIKTEEL